jgi:GDPmannose 4,6-dehydratase
MLAAESPSDFVIGTGKLTSLEQVVDIAFRRVNLNWKDWVSTDQRFVRPLESRAKVADSSKAHHELGWTANTTIEQLIEKMVDHDLELLERRPQRAA